jgi:opacity protein-like surface antigen
MGCLCALLAWLALFALPATAAQGAAADEAARGWYAVAGAGSTSYEYSNGFFEDRSAHGTGIKLGAGYRFGVFALEGWATDFGRADIEFGRTLRAQSLAVTAAWYLQAGAGVHAFLRVGAAQFRERRTDWPASTDTRLTGGVGLLFDLTPRWGIEVAAESTDALLVGQAMLISIGTRLRF